MSVEQPASKSESFEESEEYKALVADSAKRGEPVTREHNPVKAEHVAHAMKPHIEDAILLKQMAAEDRAVVDASEDDDGGLTKKGFTLREKANTLDSAEHLSREAAVDAADEAEKAYGEGSGTEKRAGSQE